MRDEFPLHDMIARRRFVGSMFCRGQFDLAKVRATACDALPYNLRSAGREA